MTSSSYPWFIPANDFVNHLGASESLGDMQIKGRYDLKIQVFKSICKELSALSYDPKHKVATIIFTNDFRDICAIGYNGNYKGGPNERESDEVGRSGFLHSEENALIHLDVPYGNREDLILMCTHKPCPMCMKRIVNSGIRTVLYIDEYNAAGDVSEIVRVGKIDLRKV